MCLILHVSDLHCGSPQFRGTHEQIVNAISGAFNDGLPDLIVASGDFTYRGQEQGFKEARQLLTRICSAISISVDRIIICPGNHDLNLSDLSNPLGHYNEFASSLLGNSSLMFGAKTVVKKTFSEIDYWIINSVYALEKDFGLVDTTAFAKLLEAQVGGNGRKKVCVVHHHLINQFSADISVLRNAYNFLEILDKYNFELVLHGHQHSRQSISLGGTCFPCYGVRPLTFAEKGTICGFSTVHIPKKSSLETSINDYILDYSGDDLVARKIS